MQILFSLWLTFFTAVFIANLPKFCDGSSHERQVHIVYMGALPEGEYQPSSHHVDMLRAVMGLNFGKQHLIQSYTRSFNGFAANLTEEERKQLLSLAGVVSIFPNRIMQLQTTRSWDFIGFPESVTRNPTVETDIIVGVIDSGIWPESESFNDKGIGPVPSKWKGVCEGGNNFTCNKKLIGARDCTKFGVFPDVRDRNGHGSHTASIVAGNSVNDVSFYGLAKGTVRGGVPSSRIAAYKACIRGCYDSDILAAFDNAISDGVDIISISIATSHVRPFYEDTLAIGAFHAMEKGILTVQAAGNDGHIGTASVAPWILTVAASNSDRKFYNKVVLGDLTEILGNSIDNFNTSAAQIPLIYGDDVTSKPFCLGYPATICESECLDKEKVKGKIVVCDSYSMSEALSAGAAGSIVLSDRYDVSRVVPMSAAALTLDHMEQVKNYMNSTKTPTANIIMSTNTVQDFDAPLVASFSSRGPNKLLPDILKPDLTAPGVSILAAFSPEGYVSNEIQDKRSVNYSILSGTSMSCPHVSGAAAYVKSFHLDWSPSAIKSALMTTAREMKSGQFEENEFANGAGHIDPLKAKDPGLVYNITKENYIEFLCNLNYKIPAIGIMVGGNFTCPKGVKVLPKDLNYPSMTAKIGRRANSFSVEFKRTVTNVGFANSTYVSTVQTENPKLNITVEPNILSFKSLNEEKSFVVRVTGSITSWIPQRAALIWSDGSHTVRSPLVFYY